MGAGAVSGLESQPQAELELALAVEVCAVDIQRLSECGAGKTGFGVHVETGEESQRRLHGRSAGGSWRAAACNVIAGGFNLRYVFMVEEIEALGEQFELAHLA